MKAGKFRDTDFIRSGTELDERVIAAERNARILQGFAHEERARSRRRAREGDEIAASQSVTTLWDLRFRQIPPRRVK